MSEVKERLEAMVEKMPAFPASVSTILDITSDINCAPKDLVKVIELDPVLTMKVLKLVNSAYFGLSREVTSVKHSVVYVGINTIKNVAISIAAIGVLPHTSSSGYNLDQFLQHSLSTAAIARLLARSKGVPESDLGDYFVASLLHDIGQMVVGQYMPDEFQSALAICNEQEIPICEAEREIFGIDHAEIGAMLAESWQLPAALISCIRNHHQVGELEEPTVLEKTIFIANQVSKLMGGDRSGLSQQEPVPEVVSSWLGMPVSEVADSLNGLDEEIEKCNIFIQNN
ncbi:MAG: HDOD domain-containing protein [Gammaproteobacteria bacterium]|nr:HDOD domain-containing protein [Gammaproteobacteria bacterium]